VGSREDLLALQISPANWPGDPAVPVDGSPKVKSVNALARKGERDGVNLFSHVVTLRATVREDCFVWLVS
jgi:hypothetical protein